MRWKKFVGGLALSLTVATGCKQPVFMTSDDFYSSQQMAALPKDLETNPAHGSVVPDVHDKMLPKPTDVLDPERPVRYLTLTEAFALALENGNIGNLPTPTATGLVDDTLALRVGDLTTALDVSSIRVLALEPALYGTNIEAALAHFDAAWVTSASWNNADRPTTTANNFQTSGTFADVRTQLVKPLASGGVAGITFDTPYQFSNFGSPTGQVRNLYTPSLQFQFEQPLLQGFGVDVNQVRPTIGLNNNEVASGTILGLPITTPQNQFVQGGIVITRVRYDQSRAVLETQFNQMLLNVEVAYWNLYAAYGQLYAQEIGVREYLEIWRLTRERVEAGVKTFTPADLYDAQGHYETARSAWLQALGQVLEAERNLRGLVGLPVSDNSRLVPTDAPTLAPVRPDWESGLQEALTLRPELVVLRENLKAHQLNLLQLKNQLLPDLRFAGTYEITGAGNTLDGPNGDVHTNALRDLASNRFDNWTMALRLTVPLGFRDANAGIRQGRLRLAENYWALRQAEDKVQRGLALQYRHLLEFQGQIQRNLSATEAYNNEIQVRLQRIRAGTDTPDVLLNEVQFGTAAMAQYYQFVGQYNGALANYEWAKGTLLRRDNVLVADGPLPNCAQVRAVEHEEERAKALELRERAAPVPCDGAASDPVPPAPAPAPRPDLLSIPDWLRTRQPLPTDGANPPAPAPAPAPRTLDQFAPTTSAAPRPAAPTVPTAAPAAPSVPAAGSASSYGVMRPLSFPEDRRVPAALPALPDGGTGSR